MQTLPYQPNLATRSFQIRQHGDVLDIRLPRLPRSAEQTVMWCVMAVPFGGIPCTILWLIATSATNSITASTTPALAFFALGGVLLLALLGIIMGARCLHSGGTLRIGQRWARYAPPEVPLPSFGALVGVLDIERKDPCLAMLHIRPARFLLTRRGDRTIDQYFQLTSRNTAELDAIEAAVAAFNNRQFTPAEIQTARRKRFAGRALFAAGLLLGFLMLHGARPGGWSHDGQTQNRPLVVIAAIAMLVLLTAGCVLVYSVDTVRPVVPIVPNPPRPSLIERLVDWWIQRQARRLYPRTYRHRSATASDQSLRSRRKRRG